jgi:sigma-B regulation protein RsbU (phosphoserine phosphatase)
MAAPKILIVDDTPLNVEMIDELLKAEGFQTLTAADGPECRRLSSLERPDLILLDVLMPGESGFETCALLKSDPLTTDIPIIFLSALADVKSKVNGLKIGGVDYLSKPVYGEEVLARVRVHLRIRENTRAAAREQQARLEQLRNAQQAILVRPEDCPDASFAVYYRPLEEAGGDFYDVVAVDSDVFAYFVADVSGHGASAAFLTSAVKALLRQYTGSLYSPEDTMRGVDAVMRQVLGEGQYLTASYAHLNRRTRKLSVVSAGHPPMILVNPTGEVHIVQMDSQPLGIFSALVLQRKDLRVSTGDRFFLYSDGLIESAPGGGRRMGIERLAQTCVRHGRDRISEAPERIARDVRSEMPAAADDLLLLAVEVTK